MRGVPSTPVLRMGHHAADHLPVGRRVAVARILDRSVTHLYAEERIRTWTNERVTATVRAGCQTSDCLDVLGDVGRTLRYVRIGLNFDSTQ